MHKHNSNKITLPDLQNSNLQLLEKTGCKYQIFKHTPVLTYEQARNVRQQFGLSGVESKSLFMQLKDGRYCMFISVEGARFDSKKIKALLGSKPRICTGEELTRQTGCLPFAACPFGHRENITLIIDHQIYKHDRFIYSPGEPGWTIEIGTVDIPVLLLRSSNPVVEY